MPGINVQPVPIVEPCIDIATVPQLIEGLPHTGRGGVIKAVPISGFTGGYTEYFLHVLRWEIALNFEEEELPCSGNLGASDGRRIGYHYDWTADILINAAYPADVILRGNFGVQLFFFLGDITRPSLTALTAGERVYVCPMAALTRHSPKQLVADKKFVKTTVTGKTRAHILLSPDQGTPSNANSVVGAYFQFYQAKMNKYVQPGGISLDLNVNKTPS